MADYCARPAVVSGNNNQSGAGFGFGGTLGTVSGRGAVHRYNQ
jgi:hypothetical protein